MILHPNNELIYGANNTSTNHPYAEELHNAIGDRDIPLYRNNRLLFIAKENNPLDFGTIYRICGAVQILFGNGLVWDIVEDSKEQADALLLLNYKR